MNALAHIKAGGKTTALYAAVTTLVLLLCYGLNYAGNQLPYQVAQKRFADTFDSAGRMSNTGLVFHRKLAGGAPTHDYCRIAGMALAGATAGNAAVDAVFVKNLLGHKHPEDAFCETLKVASVDGAPADWVNWARAKFRYRWGGTMLFAAALRFMSVAQFHALVEIATYGAYLLFAGALFALGWRALAMGSPFLLLGPFFTDIARFAEAENGVTHLWAVLAAAALAALLAHPKWRARAPVFCFVAGAVSMVLWLWDGHNFYAMALIGVVAWAGYARLNTREQTRAAFVCVALYTAGFIALFVLDQSVKGALYGLLDAANNPDLARGADEYANNPDYAQVAEKYKDSADSVLGDLGTALFLRLEQIFSQQGNPHYILMRGFEGFFPLLATAAGSFAKALAAAAALAWAVAIALAWHQFRRGKRNLFYAVLFFAILTLAFSVHFLLPDDTYPRGARYAFTPLALGFACLFYALPLPAAAPRKRKPRATARSAPRKRRRKRR